jgi:hypothetical protein
LPLFAAALPAFLVGCGASDRSALFGSGDDPTLNPIVSAGGASGIHQSPQGSGGDPGMGIMISVPGAGGGGTAPPPPSSTVPPGVGGAPPFMMSGGGASGTGGTPAPDPFTSPDAGPISSNPLSRCDFSGTWGSIIRVPVTWPEAPLVLHAGTGEVIEWHLSHRVRDTAATYREVTANCGIFLPDLSGSVLANNQKFGIRFPTKPFDDSDIPPTVFSTTAMVTDTDATWTAGPVAMLTGLLMADPLTAPWPSSFTKDQTPDEDMDGALGLTVVAVDPATDPSYNWPPVGLPPTVGADYPRASRISVVVRTVANLRGTISSCDQLRSAVDMTEIDGTPALNSMVIGCIKTTGETCSSDEAAFLNSARPQFTPSGPGTLAQVRMPDNVGCPDVRGMLPQ